MSKMCLVSVLRGGSSCAIAQEFATKPIKAGDWIPGKFHSFFWSRCDRVLFLNQLSPHTIVQEIGIPLNGKYCHKRTVFVFVFVYSLWSVRDLCVWVGGWGEWGKCTRKLVLLQYSYSTAIIPSQFCFSCFFLDHKDLFWWWHLRYKFGKVVFLWNKDPCLNIHNNESELNLYNGRTKSEKELDLHGF